jgi:hypothetical protein
VQHFASSLKQLLFFKIGSEVVSKPQIAFESKAQADEKAQSRRRRDEPLKRGLQRSYRTLDGVLKPLLMKWSNIWMTLN